MSGNYAHNPKVRGPSNNLWSHLGIWHAKAADALRAAMEKGETAEKCAASLIATWGASANTGGSSTGFIMEGRHHLSFEHLEQMAVIRDYSRRPDYSFEVLMQKIAETNHDSQVMTL